MSGEKLVEQINKMQQAAYLAGEGDSTFNALRSFASKKQNFEAFSSGDMEEILEDLKHTNTPKAQDRLKLITDAVVEKLPASKELDKLLIDNELENKVVNSFSSKALSTEGADKILTENKPNLPTPSATESATEETTEAIETATPASKETLEKPKINAPINNNGQASFDTTLIDEVPSHTEKFKADDFEKIKLTEAETKLFKDVTDHKGKGALENLFAPAELEKIQNHIGEIAGAEGEGVKAAQANLETYVKELVSNDGILKDLKPEARAGAAQRAISKVAVTLKEAGDGKGETIKMSDDAKKALETETLTKTVAEKAGGAKNWASKVIERGSSMMEGMNAESGEALGSKWGKVRVAGGSAVALGGIVLGAKNIMRGVAGYENPDTGEQEAGSFGKVAFGAAEVLGGAAAGMVAATGKWR